MVPKEAYTKLIDDTLSYLKETYPQTKKVTLPAAPKVMAPLPKKPTKPQIKTQLEPKTPEPKAQKEKEKPLLFSFDPPRVPPVEPQEKWRNLLRETTPELYLHEVIPSDEKAKRIKAAWKEKCATPDIPILYQGPHYRSFLGHLAKAIETRFFPSRIIDIDLLEKEKKWDLFLESPQLKLILAPDHIIFGLKQLLPFYKEHPQQKTRYLGQVPLLLLPDLSLYFKDPYLKRSLWNVICQALSSNSTPLSS